MAQAAEDADALPSPLSLPAGTKWHKRRKMLTPAFHFTILDQFMDVFNEQSDVLVSKLKDTGGERVNVFPFIAKATLDIICGRWYIILFPYNSYAIPCIVFHFFVKRFI